MTVSTLKRTSRAIKSHLSLKIQDTRSLFPNPMTCILLCINVYTEYYYDYNGNGRCTITYIGCLPGAPGKVI